RFFYPVGNTPPVCLTQDLSPDEDAQILLLGCGDPRSILYTVHVDLASDYRNLDITCCDWEPAILARNVILLSMAAVGVPAVNAWSIFYHFFLDDATHAILLSHCKDLLDASSSTVTWAASKYARYIRFCTDHSLVEVRRHWRLYVDSKKFSTQKKMLLRKSITDYMQTIREKYGSGSGMGSGYSVGLFLPALHEECTETYGEFWSTGTLEGDARGRVSDHVNPTFVYSLSGDSFNVHYGMNPLSAFHLSCAVANNPLHISTKDFVDSAKDQFRSWLSSFKTRISAGDDANLTIRFFVGESLAFCRALHVCKHLKKTKTGIYSNPWGGCLVDLNHMDYNDPSMAPVSFNVVDTSNLTDHTGLLNILLLVIPLLQKKPWSVLYTNTLKLIGSTLLASPNTSALSQLARVDIPSMSLLLGLAPTAHLSHFTVNSDEHCAMHLDQFQDIIAWKFPTPLIPGTALSLSGLGPKEHVLSFDAEKLGVFFFQVYQKLFIVENTAECLMNPFHMIFGQSTMHDTRATFALFLVFVRRRVEVDWSKTVNHFLKLVVADRSLLTGPHNYQDLLCYLHLYGAYDDMDSFHRSLVICQGGSLYDAYFSGWDDIPPYVCVVLTVPRSSIRPVERMDPSKIKVPMLYCMTNCHGGRHSNIHSVFQPIFGSTSVYEVSGSGEPRVIISEDKKGWDGDSSLIVTFYMASWILLSGPPESIKVGLHFRITPSTVRDIKPVLGPMLEIYSTSLADAAHVQVVRYRPNNPGELETLRSLFHLPKNPSSKDNTRQKVSVGVNNAKFITLTVRKEIIGETAVRSLSSGAVVRTTPVNDYSVLVAFDGFEENVVFPFPICTGRVKIRIARKSSYIEIEAPIRPHFKDSLDVSLNMFPVACQAGNINLLNIPYVNLDRLPALKLPMSEDFTLALQLHMMSSLTEYEQRIIERSDQAVAPGPFIELKRTIACIVSEYCYFQKAGVRKQVFGLFYPGLVPLDCYALLFINEARIDVGSHNLVLDACAVPIYEKLLLSDPRKMKLFLLGIPLLTLKTLKDEALAWFSILPVLAERCRTWKHLPSCEYRKMGIPPTPKASSPLCSCGKGKNLGAFGKKDEYKLLHGDATRIAINPLFDFSYTQYQTLLPELLAGLSSKPAGIKLPQSYSFGARPVSSVPTANLKDGCDNCHEHQGKAGQTGLSFCSACKKARYCSRECQKAHWKVHKKYCVKA
ncbi:hypothetical protein CPC08DRAFT_706665, partial [Agrocybe pediades]